MLKYILVFFINFSFLDSLVLEFYVNKDDLNYDLAQKYLIKIRTQIDEILEIIKGKNLDEFAFNNLCFSLNRVQAGINDIDFFLNLKSDEIFCFFKKSKTFFIRLRTVFIDIFNFLSSYLYSLNYKLENVFKNRVELEAILDFVKINGDLRATDFNEEFFDFIYHENDKFFRFICLLSLAFARK